MNMNVSRNYINFTNICRTRKATSQSSKKMLKVLRDGKKNQPWLEAADNERPECCCLSRNVWNETKPTEGSQIMRIHGREDFYCAWITDLITLQRMERRRPRYTRIFHDILNHILSRFASLKHISTSCRWLRTSAWHLLNLLCDPSLSGR